jgi:hypothetical protein
VRADPGGPYGLPHHGHPVGVDARQLPREMRLGREVELVEHASLPRSHRRGRRRAEVRNGEQVQIAKTLAAPHAPAKLRDRRLVVEVPSRGDPIHEEVVHHELACVGGVLRRQPQPGKDRLAHVRADLRVLLERPGRVGPTLAHVVKERRQKERHGARDLGRQARPERVLVRELAARKLAQAIDGRDRVNVDRIHMVDVVVDATGHREKLGHHREEQPHVVELTDHRAPPGRRLRHRRHELHEELRRLGLAA